MSDRILTPEQMESIKQNLDEANAKLKNESKPDIFGRKVEGMPIFKDPYDKTWRTTVKFGPTAETSQVFGPDGTEIKGVVKVEVKMATQEIAVDDHSTRNCIPLPLLVLTILNPIIKGQDD